MSEQIMNEKNKLTPFEVYIALVKGYCVILILILPRAFVTGGIVTTALLIAASGLISGLCASLLVQAGLQTRISSYPHLTAHVLGDKMKVIIDICISMA